MITGTKNVASMGYSCSVVFYFRFMIVRFALNIPGRMHLNALKQIKQLKHEIKTYVINYKLP